MKKRRSLFQKAVSLFTGFLLIFQSLTPNYFISSNVFAEDSTPPEVTTTEAPTPNPTEILEPTKTPQPTVDEPLDEIEIPEAIPTIVPTETKTSTPEPIATPTTEPTSVLEPTATPTTIQDPTPTPSPWTFENVQKDTPYLHNGVILTFTELPEPSGNIKIEEITLTEEQIEATGALSDKAYDITSDMENRKFTYTLSLPIPESAIDKEVEIKFAEDETKFNEAETIENTTKTSDESVLTGQLNHFTIFFVTSGKDSTLLSFPVSLNATDKTELNKSDNNRYETVAYWPLSWDADFQKNQYIEFTFNPDIPDGASITGASILFEYQRDSFKSGSSRDAQIRAWNGTDFNTIIANYADLQLSNPNVDELKTISVPLDLVNTSQKANAFKFRFYMRGRGPLYALLLKTRHDYVGLNVTYTLPAPINGKPHNKRIPTNDFYFEWDAVNDTRSVTYEFQSSHSNSVDGNGSLIGAWNSILNGNTEQNHLTVPEIHSTGAGDGTYYWQVRAINSDGIPGPWSEVWNMTIDRVAPVITIAPYDGTTPTNQDIIVTASTNEGSLNETSHIFTENGSFDFVATDPAGNISSKTVTITNIDKTKPTTPTALQFKNPNLSCGAITNIKTVTIDWEDSTDNVDVAGYDYSINYPLPSGGRGTWNTFFTQSQYRGSLNEGLHNVQVRAKDTAGNVSDWTPLCNITYDSIAPTGTISYSTVAITNGNVIATLVPSETINITNNGGLVNYTFTENGTFTFTFNDLAGNTGNAIATVDNIDKTPPGIPELISPANNAVVKGNPRQSWSRVSDANYYVYESYTDIDGLHKIYSANLTGTSRTVGGNQNITFYWRVKAVDIAGNESWSAMRKLTVDNTIPTLDEKTLFEGWYNTDQTSIFTYADANGISSGGDVTCDIETEGVNQTCSVTPNVCDVAGNCNTTPVTSNGANIDFTNPESIITLPENPNSGSTVYTNAWDGSIQGTANDALSGVQGVQVSIQNLLGQFFDGDSFVDWEEEILLDTVFTEGNWEYTDLTTPLEGSYIIKSHAIDTAGNIENTYEITIILDKTIPEVTLSINPAVGDGENGWYKTQPEITLTATEEHIDKIEYQWDSETGEWTTYTSPFKLASEGTHVLYYRALDLANNYSDIGIKNIAWDKTALEKAPQNVSVSPNPSNGKNVKVIWEAATDNTGIDHYTITWKKDGVGERGTNVSETTREYIIPDTLTEGVWNVKVTAVDKAGFTADASTNATVDLTAPAAPTLALTGTGVGSVSLAWNEVDGAVDYSVWYGTTAGVYDYAAHVGNVTSYTIQGLGAGTYYVVVAAYDNVVNRSAFSNEVNTGGAIAGAPGATTGPAEGFQPAGSVLGSETVNHEDSGQTLGEATPPATPNNSWIFVLLGLLLISISTYLYYRQRRRNP